MYLSVKLFWAFSELSVVYIGTIVNTAQLDCQMPCYTVESTALYQVCGLRIHEELPELTKLLRRGPGILSAVHIDQAICSAIHFTSRVQSGRHLQGITTDMDPSQYISGEDCNTPLLSNNSVVLEHSPKILETSVPFPPLAEKI